MIKLQHLSAIPPQAGCNFFSPERQLWVFSA